MARVNNPGANWQSSEPQAPHVGALVLFTTERGDRAAIVTGLVRSAKPEAMRANLHVVWEPLDFPVWSRLMSPENPGGNFISGVAYDRHGNPGTWHWPEARHPLEDWAHKGDC